MGMKIKINQEGMLVVNDKNKNCPFAPFEQGLHTAESYCGDWCALFGEPEQIQLGGIISEKMQLQLCHKTLYFTKDDFEDLRSKANGE